MTTRAAPRLLRDVSFRAFLAPDAPGRIAAMRPVFAGCSNGTGASGSGVAASLLLRPDPVAEAAR